MGELVLNDSFIDYMRTALSDHLAAKGLTVEHLTVAIWNDARMLDRKLQVALTARVHDNKAVTLQWMESVSSKTEIAAVMRHIYTESVAHAWRHVTII